MQYRKLPGNIYTYRSTIFGIPLREALILSILAAFTILVVRINLYLPFISAFSLPVYFLYRRSFSGADRHSNRISRRGKDIFINYSRNINRHLGHLILVEGRYGSIFFEVAGINLLAMRRGVQKSFIENLSGLTDDPGDGLDFFSLHYTENEGERKKTGYRTIIRVNKIIAGSNGEHDFTDLIAKSQAISSILANHGFYPKEIESSSEVEEIIDSLVN